MQKNAQWLQQLTDNSHIGILVVDQERKTLFVNKHLSEMFGYDEKTLLSVSAEILHINHQTYLEFAKIVLNPIRKGESVSIDYKFKRKNGDHFWVHISGDPIKNTDEILWILVDITNDVTIKQHDKELQERLELALLGNKDGIWDWDLRTNKVYYSPRWKNMLGYEDSELKNDFSTWEELAHPDDMPKVLADIQTHLAGESDFVDNAHRMKHKDGHWVWIQDRAKAIFDTEGNPLRMSGTHTDITKQKALLLKFEQQAQMIEQTHDSVNSTDLEGNILTWNSGSEKLFGYTSKEIIGQHISILQKEGSSFKITQDIYTTLLAQGEIHADVQLAKKSQETIHVALSLSLLRDEFGEPTAIVGYAQDISKRKKAEKELAKQRERLQYQAHYDVLTGLPNRVLFSDRLTHSLEKSKRKHTKMALLFLDLDHFKEINDSLGHDAGDKVLKTITSKLNKVIRAEDTIARLGGDEFTIILNDLTNPQDASLISSKLLQALSEPIIIDDNTLYVSISIGISIYPDDGEDTQSLLKFADSAMYKAKSEGRNNFQYYSSEMTEKAFERVVMETSLRNALTNKEFIVYYQPQINGKTNTLVGMEALVRWQHPTMGLVSPAKFIPLAESTGLIVELDRYVMKTAMTQLSSWYAKGLNPGTLAMNLAVKQLQTNDFLEFLTDLLVETKCDASWIELEVTESQVMTKPQEIAILLQKINDLGVKIAIDDFGTGYSSLAYLKKLPITKLKIDQTFIRDLPDDEEDAAITRAVIGLAKSLNLNIIAEGVETQEQKEFIVANGCQNIQGYFYSKPINAQEFELFLKKMQAINNI